MKQFWMISILLLSTFWLSACKQAEQDKVKYTSSSQGPVEADTPLPGFAACASTAQPILPEKWQSGAILQHFSMPDLIVANLHYDETAAAFRFTLAGIEQGIGDFLLTDSGSLYRLSGPLEQPDQCSLIGSTKMQLPPRNWVADDGLCVGDAPVIEKNLSWWKTEVPDMSPAGADWFWFDKDNNNLPFRTMFSKPTYDYGILGLFTFDYFANFQEVSETNLGQLKQLCQSSNADNKPSEPGFDPNSVVNLLGTDTLRKEERKALINNWIPGLEPTDTSLPASWPTQVEGTTFMTSVNYCYAPFPTRVYFDWSAQAQNTAMYWNQEGAIPSSCSQSPAFFVQEALLLGKHPVGASQTGYIYNRDSAGNASACHQVLPGVQMPNWMQVDSCIAKAQLQPGSIFNPTDEVVKIVHCPITKPGAAIPQMFWTWYSVSGKPMVFMQSNSNTDGTGLNLADYYSWTPGAQAPSGLFDLPTVCEGQPKVDVPESCHNCHLPLGPSD